MEKQLFFLLFVIAFSGIFSQNDEDVLRYTRPLLNGTGRFTAMGGAMGAMGADLSALNNNPAGLGVYIKSDVAVTAGFRFSNVNSSYNDSTQKDFRSGFVMPNIGICGAGVNRELEEDHFIRSNFAISLNRLANFKNNIQIAGNSRGSSMGLAFSAAAQGKNPGDLDMFYESGPFYYDLIDTVNGDPTLYESAIPAGADNTQQFEAVETGGISELSIGGGYSYDDRFYAGWGIGVLFLNYTRSSLFTETCNDLYKTPNLNTYINSFFFEDNVSTTGKGINLKLGGIYRVSESFRVGLAYHTGSIYAMKDTYKSRFGITYSGLGSFEDSTYTGNFRYTMITPEKLQASIAILLEKAVAINVDVEFMNYGRMRLKSKPDYFASVNKFIRQEYVNTTNIKIGFERNVKPVIIRGGYALYGSPNGSMMGKGARHTMSLGSGFRWSNKFVDVSFSLSLNKSDYYLYNPLYVNPATQRFAQSFLLLTYGAKI